MSTKTKMEPYRILLLSVFSLVAILFMIAGCTTAGKNLPSSEATATISDNTQQIEVHVESFFYKPNRVIVNVNIPVRLTLKSGAFIIPHNFSLQAPEAGIEISQNVGHGKKVVVEFTPTKVGEYPFFCAKDGHSGKGMTGTLVVVP